MFPKIFFPEIDYYTSSSLLGGIYDQPVNNNIQLINEEDIVIKNSIFRLLFCEQYEYDDYVITVKNVRDDIRKIYFKKSYSLLRQLELYPPDKTKVYITYPDGEDLFNFQEDIFILDILKDFKKGISVDLSQINYADLSDFQKCIYTFMKSRMDYTNSSNPFYYDSTIIDNFNNNTKKSPKDLLGLLIYNNHLINLVNRIKTRTDFLFNT